MANELHRGIWDAYERAWNSATAEERKVLLGQAVDDECTFGNLIVSGKGILELTAVIDQFQRENAGGRFETIEFIEQHEQSLAHWNLIDVTGSVILSGFNYTRYGSDSRMVHIAGILQIK